MYREMSNIEKEQLMFKEEIDACVENTLRNQEITIDNLAETLEYNGFKFIAHNNSEYKYYIFDGRWVIEFQNDWVRFSDIQNYWITKFNIEFYLLSLFFKIFAEVSGIEIKPLPSSLEKAKSIVQNHHEQFIRSCIDETQDTIYNKK